MKFNQILRNSYIILTIGFVLSSNNSLAESIVNSIIPVSKQISYEPLKPASFEEVLKERDLEADISFILFDSEDGKILEAINPTKQYPLASITKLITALFAFDTLGSQHVFKTTVEFTGELEDGFLKGDMILRGGSDPTLSNDHLVRLIEILWGNGVRKVEGKFMVDSSDSIYHRHIDSQQPEYLSYNPSISGLNLNFNRVLFRWNKSNGAYNFNFQARSDNNNFDVSTTEVRLSKNNYLFESDNYNGRDDKWIFKKPFLDRAQERWLPVRNPEKYAGELFWKIANEAGIEIPKPIFESVAIKGKILAEVSSEPLYQNIELMLKYSNNLMSEVLGLTSTKQIVNDKRNILASAEIMRFWLENKIGKFEGNFIDHSGLGERSTMSSDELRRFLEQTELQELAFSLMSQYKVKKSQSSLIKNYVNIVKVKTGSLNFVSNLAGYLETKSKKKLLFVILASNMKKRGELRKSDRDNPLTAKIWNRKARQLQLDLIENWAFKYN